MVSRKGSPLPPAPFALVGFLDAGVLASQYSDPFDDLFFFKSFAVCLGFCEQISAEMCAGWLVLGFLLAGHFFQIVVISEAGAVIIVTKIVIWQASWFNFGTMEIILAPWRSLGKP